MIQPLWEAVWRFLKKINIELSYNPVILILGIYPKKQTNNKKKEIRNCKRYLHTHFHCSIIHNTKMWKEPTSSIDEWIKKKWLIHTIEHYSGLKKNILPFAVTWMDLEDIMLSEMSVTEGQIHDLHDSIYRSYLK